MRFSSKITETYRSKGHYIVAVDVGSFYYDIFLLVGEESFHIDGYPSLRTATKLAKEMAMENKYGFNPKTDVIAEKHSKYKVTRKDIPSLKPHGILYSRVRTYPKRPHRR